MKSNAKKPVSVEEYIANSPVALQKKLKQLRSLIKKAAPKAIEKISYGMPAYSLEGPLVYFSLAKSHIGFYGMPSTNLKFEKELKKFDTSKGTIRFNFEDALPATLITKMVKFRVKENTEKLKLKKPRSK